MDISTYENIEYTMKFETKKQLKNYFKHCHLKDMIVYKRIIIKYNCQFMASGKLIVSVKIGNENFINILFSNISNYIFEIVKNDYFKLISEQYKSIYNLPYSEKIMNVSEYQNYIFETKKIINSLIEKKENKS